MNNVVETEVNSPIEILQELGILKSNKKGKIKGVYKDQLVDEMIQRKEGFDWVHLGNTDIPIKNLYKVLKKNPNLTPPRTGHMGNWEDIVNGRAGMIDYNKTIIKDLNMGYPLIYSNNQTEDNKMESGDWIYLPGSNIENGDRKILDLYTWDGKNFSKRDRNKSYFTPFVLTPIEKELIPLTVFHWRKMSLFKEMEYKMFDTVIIDNWSIVKNILTVLVENSIRTSSNSIELKDIFAHEVSLEGTIERSNINFDGTRFNLGENYFESIDALIEAAKLPLIAVSKPEDFFGKMNNWPKQIPVISKTVTTILFSILNTHYKNSEVINREKMTQPFNPHLHWGALSLAGYPPFVKGTFSNKDNIKKISIMQKIIINHFPQIDPTFFILLPAAPFTLYPTHNNPNDFELIENLVSEVINLTRGLENKPNVMMNQVGETVKKWIIKNESNLSQYFLNKFNKRRSVLNTIDLPSYSEYIELPIFREMTFKQGCMITGHLLDHYKNK